MMSVRSSLIPLMKLSNVAIPLLAFGGAGILSIAWESRNGDALFGWFRNSCTIQSGDVTSRVQRQSQSVELAGRRRHGGGRLQTSTKALFWAAMTYVVGAFGAIAQALYFAKLFLGRRSRD